MAARSRKEREAGLRVWQKAHPGEPVPVHIWPPGADAPKKASPQAIAAMRSILKVHADQLLRLEKTAVAPVQRALDRAKADLSTLLKTWVEQVPDGHLRFSAHKYRQALLWCTRAARTLRSAMEGALEEGGLRAQHMAIDHQLAEVARFSSLFGKPVHLELDRVRLVATGQSVLSHRYPTSAARYEGRVLEDLKELLASHIARGSTLEEMVQEMKRHGGPRGLVATRGIAGHPGAIVENIPEGLFVRYESWARRWVRTELASSYNLQSTEALIASKERLPTMMKRWAADGSGCPRICEPMDGQVVEVHENFQSPIGPVDTSAHPNCRCRVTAWLPEWASMGVPGAAHSRLPHERAAS